MASNIKKVPMQHPFKKDRSGMPFIQMVNERTAKAGKLAKLGYIPVPRVTTPPTIDLTKNAPATATKPTPSPKTTPTK